MMNLRPLGDTGLQVTPLGLGMAALGRPGYINLGHADDLKQDYRPAAMEARAHEVLSRAYQGGIRYFDTARSYGKGESFLGNWLDAHPEIQDALVGSKWGYIYTANWMVHAAVHEVKDHTLPVLQRQWEESQDNLGGLPGLYQIHSATLESGVLDNVAVLDELARMRARHGLVIGLSLSGPDQAATLEKALNVHRDGQPLFGAVQATFNLLEPTLGPWLAEARAQGLGTIVKEGLANGRLTSRNTAPHFAESAKVLENLAAAHHTTLDALALAWVLHQPGVDVVLSGAAQPAQVESNLMAVELSLSQADLAALGALAEAPEQYWQTRKGLAWT